MSTPSFDSVRLKGSPGRKSAAGCIRGARALTVEQVAQARTWVNAGVPKAEVARRLGAGRTTLYIYLKS